MKREASPVRGEDLPLWAYKAARRLLTLRAPGVYALALVVREDGGRELVVSGSKREVVGR